jgi:FkbM family methyltransferase
MTVGVGAGLVFDPGPSNPAYASGNNELPVQAVLEAHLKPGGIFYDVGANVGFFTVLAARLVGATGAVYAFEPVAENACYARLNARLNGFPWVAVIETAIASVSGSGGFRLADYSGGGALATVDQPPDFRGSVSVEIASLDELVFRRGLPPPQMVKIDVEGAELAVLHGASRLLADVRPTIIYEVDDAVRDRLEHKHRDMQTYLRRHRYRVERIDGAYDSRTWHVSHGLAVPLENHPE